ncbi:CapA family protein [Metallococcus carri]|uniref:CapA family protein n=1 Tax=Metallococcus carri TaxID=1656884 RepID=UPI00140D9C04|nr:CapA family protein [Metallococcus carri]
MTIEFSGDDIPQEEIIAAAKKGDGYDFEPMFAPVKAYTSSADVSICQMETTLTPTNTNLTRSIVHRGPREFATAVRNAGYDGCSTANNHTFDAGVPGLATTQQVMTSAGLQVAGPGDATNPVRTAWYTAKGLKIAQLSYSYTLDNWAQGSLTGAPPDAPWLKQSLYAVRGAAGISADAAKARAAGADIVLVSLHWGTQFAFEPSGDQVALAQQLLASPNVDMIIGNHPHVVQRCGASNGKLVFYSLGNQLSNQGVNWGFPDATQDGVMVKVTLTKSASGLKVDKAEYQPTRARRTGGYIIDQVSKASNPSSWASTSRLIQGPSNACQLTPAP